MCTRRPHPPIPEPPDNARVMSTAKRTRGRQSDTGATPALPPNKKAKTTKDSGLAFLTDEHKRSNKKIRAQLTNGVKDAKTNRVDESKAMVGGHQADADKDVVDISSGDDSSEYESSDNDEAQEEAAASKQLTNGDVDIPMNDAEGEGEAEADEAPSFGDLLHASHPETIDVQAAFTDRNAQDAALVPINGNRVLTAPSATSLGTVLTQALRTNDKDLLESCFQTRETQSIRSTIQRLQSPLVADLLQRLAERLYKRPGRAGNLMVWVQWSLVAHGGYLAGQPQVLKKLKALSQVVRERASGLQSLMTLKGKLDMLGAQLELRQAMQETRANMFDDDEEDPNVVYIEGEEAESDDDSLDEQDVAVSRKQKKIAGKRAALDSDNEDVDDLAMTNGVADSEDESEDAEDDDVEGLIDDEAEVTSDEEGEDSDDDVDEDEEVSEDDVDESASEDEAPPVKAPKPQRSAGRKR